MGNFGKKMRYVTFRLGGIEREAPEEDDFFKVSRFE